MHVVYLDNQIQELLAQGLQPEAISNMLEVPVDWVYIEITSIAQDRNKVEHVGAFNAPSFAW